MANRRVDLSSFPKLKLQAGDVTGSFRSWFTSFRIAVEVTGINLGVDNDNVERFRGRTKLLALLSAVGSDGVETLQSLGFNVDSNEDNAYDDALALLRTHYEREESIYVKTMKFVTVSQAIGEDEKEYLLRVAKLSRSMGFGAGFEQWRVRFAVALAVNGLRESEVRKEMMAQADLTWEQLTARLNARYSARQSEALVSEAKAGQFHVRKNIKTEVANVNVDEKGDSSTGDFKDSSIGRASGVPHKARKRFDSPRGSRYDKEYRPRRDSSRSSDEGKWFNEDRRSRKSSPSQRVTRDSSTSSNRTYRRYDSPAKDNTRCFQCNREGHRVRNCPDVYCFSCNQKGHTSKDCSNRYSKGSRDYKSYRYASDSSDSSGSRSPTRRVRFVEGKSGLYGRDNSIKRMLKVNGKEVEFTFDTGAEVSVVTEKTSKILGLELTEPEKGLTGADGSKLNVTGMSKVCIKSTFRSVNAPVYVLRGSGRNLLGLPEIRNLNLLGRKTLIVKRKGGECESGSMSKVRAGASYSGAVSGQRQASPPRKTVLSKVVSFLSEISEGGIMGEGEYEDKRSELVGKKEELRRRYEREMAAIEREE